MKRIPKQKCVWISIKDHIPQEGQEVLVPLNKFGKKTDTRIYREGLFYEGDYGYGLTYMQSKYWIPLPPPPTI